MDFIADFEWYRDCAYPDWNQWSIWYWTASYKWECINKEEAYKRKKEYLQSVFTLVDKDCYSDNQKIAMSSYIYNTWWNQMGLKKNILNCNKEGVLYTMNVYWWITGWKYSRWLAKRREIEINKFNW